MSNVVDFNGGRPSLHDGTDASIVLDRLLWILGDAGPEVEAEEIAGFRNKLVEYRRALANTEPGPELANLAHSCLKTCETYLLEAREFVKNREAELLDLIGLFRRTAAALVGDTSDFGDQLLATSEKISRMAQVEDVRELKRLLTAEAQTLRTAVEAKRHRDEEVYNKLSTRVEMLQSRLSKAEAEATIDPVTRVMNRGGFDRAIQRAAATAGQSQAPLTLVMVDIDHFKSVNDTHGHPIGDRVLLNTANWLVQAVRNTDVVARYGGEEFAVIMAGARMGQVEERLTSALKALAADKFEYDTETGEKRTLRYTASVGVAELGAGETALDLIRRADDALYEAKNRGRNRVVAKKRSMLSNLFARGGKPA